jgi:invasion protein IalB
MPRPSGGENRKENMMLRVSSLRLAGAAALLLAAAAPALAAGDPPQPAQNAAPSDQASDTAATPAEAVKPKPKEEHKICRMVNGSEARLGAQRVCMTAEQWKHADQDD